MSPKKRVYDLAKEYGMSGQELAGKLRDLGFAKVKSHMTALDDFEVMEIQGRLEAYGIVGERAAQESAGLGGGLVIKKKRKRKKEEAPTPPAAPAEAADEPEGEPDPETEELAAEPEHAEVEAAVEEPVTSEAPAEVVEAEPVAPEPVQEVAQAPAVEESPVQEGAVEEAPVSAEAPAAAPVAAEPPTEEPAPVEPEPAQAEAAAPAETAAAEEVSTPAEAATETPEPAPEEPVATQPAAESETAPDAEATPASTEAAEAPAAAAEATANAGESDSTAKKGDKEGKDADLVRPSAKRRPGKVVGFIDLSQIQPQPKRPESRRLRSSDDVAPDVRPTLGRNKRSAFQRGDQGNRGGLTAQQLREREAGRFLRRSRPMGGGGRRGGGPRVDNSGSPFSGTTVKIDEPVTVKKLAETMSVKGNELLRVAFRLLGFGSININSPLDSDTAELLANEFDVELDIVQEVAAEEQLISTLDEQRASVGDEELSVRPPTVAFLGHVDHGKTTLIDTIRRSAIAGAEAGGITQHIGAYQITNAHGHTLTIIDTPGHEAFTSMRARGASAVDIVVLVVAADDGVKPQTEEALNHARAAGTPIVVALNKCDKPEVNLDRVKTQLAGLNLNPEEWGGDTAMLPVSALKGDGIEDLLERVFLESEVLELKCHNTGPARGVVLEAEILGGKGKVAHLLVQDGCLRGGDVILAGEGYGKVRSIHDDRGKVLKSAGPSRPVEVTGLNELPAVGDSFYVVDALDQAAEVAQERARKIRQLSQIERAQVSRENLLEAVAAQDLATINLIVKSDVSGSIEVLKHQLAETKHEEVTVKIIHAGVGQVVESDVDLATTSGAKIMAFHVGTATKARQAAEREGVEIRNYGVIYELLDDVRMMMEGELSPEISEEVTGHVEIRRLFKSSRIGNIAGCYVLDGTVARDNKIRLLRDGKVIHTGEFASLKREKDDAKEVREGFECGIVLKNYNDIKEGDIVETYKLVETKRTI